MNSKALQDLRSQLTEMGNEESAAHSQRFFKTGPGQYGEGDQFLGIRVPVLRKTAKQHLSLTLADVVELLKSPMHEERLLALLILVYQFGKAEARERKRIFDTYCDNLTHVNNWDLVDCSAHVIVGGHLRNRSRRLLHKLAKSNSLWDRRIAIMSTFNFIKVGEFDETLKIAEMLLGDTEDLIHKAVGWMLREIGNRDRSVEESFLTQHYLRMPRTMLRYAIEKFPERLRKRYLNGEV